ncbi:hypothetical protein Psta_0877 [Pirellula staleyi DSM 6068]|uniref:Uncharacterized protein n=1 Tax=Pirellula staleyi (strain ATCC 27377 / DSM 6068 / ICPB 4128) TaxID=530564 RepID=D2R6I4_PIRSD|nr:hypothetical protein [Pirellula staleyi]ADB15562.1 hypothetical protein Psta_0877 [Pirellula staleyi DSM 6068]
MVARLALVAVATVLLLQTGCCCDRVYKCGDPCGSCFGPRVYNGCAGGNCGTTCGPTGGCAYGASAPVKCQTGDVGPCGQSCCFTVRGWLANQITCGRGCGEVYWGEWISDPPDRCDPCDDCYGQFVGPRGCCPPGFFGRLAHGFSCLRPCLPKCGPSCGPSCSTCGGGGEAYYDDAPAYGATSYNPGCKTCGSSSHSSAMHGGTLHGGTIHGPSVQGQPYFESDSVLEQNWDRTPPQPIPGKPIHKAQAPYGARAR